MSEAKILSRLRAAVEETVFPLIQLQEILSEKFPVNSYLRFKKLYGGHMCEFTLTPLGIAIFYCNTYLIKLLIDKGAKLGKPCFILKKDIRKKMSPLGLACDLFHIEAMGLLLNFGADVNEVTYPLQQEEEEGGFMEFYTGNTFLHCIMESPQPLDRKLKAMNILLDNGADPTIANRFGELPLHRSNQWKPTDNHVLEKFLIQHGGFISQPTKDFHFILKFVLESACGNQTIERQKYIIRLLLEEGYEERCEVFYKDVIFVYKAIMKDLYHAVGCETVSHLEKIRYFTQYTQENSTVCLDEHSTMRFDRTLEHLQECVCKGNIDFLEEIVFQNSCLRHLKTICRKKIRHSLGHIKLKWKICQLGLPISLQHYLLYNDVYCI